MNIRFYKNFSKRKNSTKQPGGGVTYADHDCVLKNPTNIENPTIVLSGHPEAKTASGNPITITDAGAGTAQSLTVDMLPIQDLHGYDKPWAGGSGKNKLPLNLANIKTLNSGGIWTGNKCVLNGVTFEVFVNDIGEVIEIKATGTATANATFVVYDDNSHTCPFNGYYLNGCQSGGTSSTYFLRVSDITTGSNNTYGNDTTINLSNTGKWRCQITVLNGYEIATGGLSFKPMIRLSTEADATFAPYSNICPISGRNSLDITVNGNTQTISFGGTIYGGTYNANGSIDNLWENIPSYAGEPLGTEWYSSLDEPNTTPTTGAQVVYKSAQSMSASAISVPLNKGTNTLSTSGGNMSLSYLTPGTQLDYDYAYIDNFKRYYFLRSTTILSNNHIQYELEEDVLASKKTAIGATVARIAFAATGWDKDIVDPRCLVKTTKIKYDASAATELTTTGCYVLTVFNKASGASNGLGATYVLDAANMQKVKEWMGNDTVYQALVNYFGGSPMESIFACIWVPFDYALSPGSAVSKIDIGNQDSTLHGINAYVLSGTGILSGTEVLITIPYRYNDFRDASPYSDAQLYLPGVGNVDINLNDFLDSTKIHILYSMEYGTGDLTYYIKDDGGNLIQTVSCNVASQCPLGQLNINGGGVVSSIGSAVGGVAALTFGAASGNAAMATGGAGALLASASSAVLSYNKRSVSLKGTLGGRTSTEITDIIFTGYYMDTEDVDDVNYIATHGRPVGVTHAISNHSGYVQCDNASVVMSGSVLERDRINDYLNTGFFYE